MYYFSKMIISGALVLFLATPATLSAQQATGVEAWRELDMAFRLAIIDELQARRGQISNIDTADELILSAEDIREALRLSCDLAGACANESSRATLGEQLLTLPATDEQQGLRNAEIILDMKQGHAKKS